MGFALPVRGRSQYGPFGSYIQRRLDDTVLRSTLDGLMSYAGNRIVLIEAKRDKDVLSDSIPEATRLSL
jgi:hypothetical protein